jgi:hypothetical protein
MALFGTQRDAKFLASINAELLNAIIDTEIEFFKLVVEESNSNIYGESTSKTYFDSILIPVLITKESKNGTMDDYGHSYTRTAQFGISRDILEKANFYPEVGDIVKWDEEYYELDNVDANQYFAGKNPDTWPNGTSFGYSVSVLCDAHVTRQTPTNIRKMRFGSPDDGQTYKGFG